MGVHTHRDRDTETQKQRDRQRQTYREKQRETERGMFGGNCGRDRIVIVGWRWVDQNMLYIWIVNKKYILKFTKEADMAIVMWRWD